MDALVAMIWREDNRMRWIEPSGRDGGTGLACLCRALATMAFIALAGVALDHAAGRHLGATQFASTLQEIRK